MTVLADEARMAVLQTKQNDRSCRRSRMTVPADEARMTVPADEAGMAVPADEARMTVPAGSKIEKNKE